MTSASDIAIVGAGITGLSVAFHLAERGGGRIVVYERDGIGAGASGVQPGGVRQQWSTRASCELALDSLVFYRSLVDRLRPRRDPVFRPCGYVFVAHEATTLERLRENVSLQNAVGVPSRIVEASEIADLVPGIRADDIVGASHCAEDGYFDRPQTVVEAFAEAAQRLGVVISRADIVSIAPSGDRWRLDFAGGARAEAGRVIVAAGAETRSLLAPFGVELPIDAEPRRIFYSEPIVDRLLDPLVIAIDRQLAAKQLGNGRLLAGALGKTGADEAAERRRLGQAVVELLPRLEFVVLALAVEGTYDVTPDHQPIVGEAPGLTRLYVAAGFSGHGFMIAPEVGRGLAAMVVGEEPGEAFAALRPDRFAHEALAPETQVI